MYIGIYELSDGRVVVRFGLEAWIWDGVAWVDAEVITLAAGATSRLVGYAIISSDYPKATVDTMREWAKAVAMVYAFRLRVERDAVAEAERIIEEVRKTQKDVLP